jgi:hypothetical protein
MTLPFRPPSSHAPDDSVREHVDSLATKNGGGQSLTVYSPGSAGVDAGASAGSALARQACHSSRCCSAGSQRRVLCSPHMVPVASVLCSRVRVG